MPAPARLGYAVAGIRSSNRSMPGGAARSRLGLQEGAGEARDPSLPESRWSDADAWGHGPATRFSYQTEETYTVIYFCPVPGCAETAEVQLAMTQIPSRGGAAPSRLRPPGLSGSVSADILVLVCAVVSASSSHIEREEHELKHASTSLDAHAGRVLDNQQRRRPAPVTRVPDGCAQRSSESAER